MKLNFELAKIRSYLFKRIKDKYRFVVLNENTLEEKFTFKLSRYNLFIIIGISSVLLVLLTTYIIAFTPLKTYIPGYTNPSIQQKIYRAEIKTDSIISVLNAQDLYIKNLKAVLSGNIQPDEMNLTNVDSANKKDYNSIRDTISATDSSLRAEYLQNTPLSYFSSQEIEENNYISEAKIYNFFPPINGVISSEFNPLINHFGVDFVAQQNELVKSIQSGVVIFAEWTAESGNVILIQHTGNIISVYKHNSVLLKKEGEIVSAGEAIAIIGQSGKESTGTQLHFELWLDRVPVNPENYISFK